MSPSEPTAPAPSAPSAPPRLNDRWTHWVRREISALPAWPFFLGVLVAFGACAYAGRIVSERPLFENFVRFFGAIQPQRYFYPTASQLVAHVRHTVPASKTLVLVGGASYFRGTGQNPGELWTHELQRQLGPRYAVVNFATDQADLTAFAGVIFSILSREYPKIIYVANGNVAAAAPVDGGADYRYLFWDAFYKGLLPSSVSKSPAVHALRRQHFRDPAALEVHAGQWLDQFAYACDLWTYLGYQKFFTVWSDEHRAAPTAPRRLARESDDPTILASQAAIRRDPAYVAHSEQHARTFARTGLIQQKSGNWIPNPAHWTRFAEECRTMFPDDLRANCVVVLLRANPFFMQSLTPDERRRTDQIYQLGQDTYERAGYQVLALQPDDFTADDYLDGGHFMPSGGAKIARAVALHLEDLERANERALPFNHPRGGPVELAVVLPASRLPREETLFALPHAAGSETLFIEYQRHEKARLVYRAGPTAPPLYSPSFSAPTFSTVHSLRMSLDSFYPRTAKETAGHLTPADLTARQAWLLIRLDGRPFWELPVAPRTSPRLEVALGIDPRAPVPGSQFTGTYYLAERRPSAPRPLRRDEIAGARLQFTLKPAMAGRSFPLATAGKPGAADVLFLRVTPQGNAVLGYDHWGSAPLVSPEIPVGFGQPHTLEFRLPALSAPHTAPDVAVTLDGQTVWQQRVPFHRPSPENIHFTQNPIGATSCEPTFPEATLENVLVPSWRG
jgi:hypothetical protein